MNKELLQKLFHIKAVLFDLHGVLIQNNNGSELENCCEELKYFATHVEAYNIKVGILSSGIDQQLRDHLEKETGVIILNSSLNKIESAEKFLIQNQLEFENLLYIGDDILDMPLLQKAGIGAAPGTARREVKRIVDYICRGTTVELMMYELFHLIEKAQK